MNYSLVGMEWRMENTDLWKSSVNDLAEEDIFSIPLKLVTKSNLAGPTIFANGQAKLDARIKNYYIPYVI